MRGRTKLSMLFIVSAILAYYFNFSRKENIKSAETLKAIPEPKMISISERCKTKFANRSSVVLEADQKKEPLSNSALFPLILGIYS